MALPASLALIGALLAAPALAQEAPDALVKRVTEEVTQHKDVRSGDPAKLRAVVETKLVPHIDTRRVTQIALRQNWGRATPDPRAAGPAGARVHHAGGADLFGRARELSRPGD